jgi:RimJ/RimL family protein N-acetyltransferase
MTKETHPSIVIRKIQPHEALLYRSIRLACLKDAPDNFGSTYEEEMSIPKLKFESYIEQENEECFMFGAFDHGNLIGIVGFERLERQRARHRGEVVQMYIDSAYRGQNLGEQLLRRLIEHAFTVKGIEQLQLSVIAGNRAAIQLYEKLGFQAFGVQPRYFKVGKQYLDQQFMQLIRDDYQRRI